MSCVHIPKRDNTLSLPVELIPLPSIIPLYGYNTAAHSNYIDIDNQTVERGPQSKIWRLGMLL